MIYLNNSEYNPIDQDLIPIKLPRVMQSTAGRLQWNLSTAHDISRYVNEIIYYSNNNPNTPRMKAEVQEIKRAYSYPSKYIRELVLRVDSDVAGLHKMHIALIGSGDQKELIFLRAQNAEYYHVGNCQDMSEVGYTYACRNHSQRVEIFFIRGGNHVFLVIGRRYNSNPKDPKRWGKSCVICDIWAQKIYPASEFESIMENFVTAYMDEETGEIICELEPYNPMKHEFDELYPYACHPDIGIL